MAQTNDGNAGPAADVGATPLGCTPVRGLTTLLVSSLPSGESWDDSSLASDGQYLYLAGGNSLCRIPIAGGPVETLYYGFVSRHFGVGRTTVAWVPLMDDGRTPAGLTVKTAQGLQSVALPDGVRPLPLSTILVDDEGNVYFKVNLPDGPAPHVWRWSPSTQVAAEMPGVGTFAVGNLYWVDRGQIIWSNAVPGPEGGIYATDVATGIPLQLAGASPVEFGGPAGYDAKNLYGAGALCPTSACPVTVHAVARDGSGTPFFAYEIPDAYWTASNPRVDDSGLYWLDWNTPGIYHATLVAGDAAELVVKLEAKAGSTLPSTFAMDACNVYWSGIGPGGALSILAAPK